MVGPGQPDKTSGPPGPVSFSKLPARPERIFCWAGLGRVGPGQSTGPDGLFRALLPNAHTPNFKAAYHLATFYCQRILGKMDIFRILCHPSRT